MLIFEFTKMKFSEGVGYQHGKEVHQGSNRPGCRARIPCLHLLRHVNAENGVNP